MGCVCAHVCACVCAHGRNMCVHACVCTHTCLWGTCMHLCTCVCTCVCVAGPGFGGKGRMTSNTHQRCLLQQFGTSEQGRRMEQMEPRQAISMLGGPGFGAQSCRPRAPLSWREQSLTGGATWLSFKEKLFPPQASLGTEGGRVGSRREGPDHRIRLERENRQGGAGRSQHLAAQRPGSVPGGQRPTSRVVPVLEVPPALPRSQRPRTVQTVACTAHPRVPGRQVGQLPGEGGGSGVSEGHGGETCRNVGDGGEAAGALEEAHLTCQVQFTPQRGNRVKTRLRFALDPLLPEGPQEIRESYVHFRELKCLASLALT